MSPGPHLPPLPYLHVSHPSHVSQPSQPVHPVNLSYNTHVPASIAQLKVLGASLSPPPPPSAGSSIAGSAVCPESPLFPILLPAGVASDNLAPARTYSDGVARAGTTGSKASNLDVSERRYSCPHCNYRCNRKSALAIHVRTHTGVKPFVCAFPSCNKQFNVKSNMRRHYRNHYAARPGGAGTPALQPQGGNVAAAQYCPPHLVHTPWFPLHPSSASSEPASPSQVSTPNFPSLPSMSRISSLSTMTARCDTRNQPQPHYTYPQSFPQTSVATYPAVLANLSFVRTPTLEDDLGNAASRQYAR